MICTKADASVLALGSWRLNCSLEGEIKDVFSSM